MKNNIDKKQNPNKEDRYFARLKEEIFGFFDINHEQAFSFNNLYKHFGIKDNKVKTLFDGLVKELVKEKRLAKLPDGTYQADNELDFVIGRVDHVNPRFAFVITEGDDVYVDARDLNGAVDGDTVKVTRWQGKSRMEGEVLEILAHQREQIVGTLERFSRHAVVTPDSRKLYLDIFIANNDLADAQTGDKVIVQITNWGSSDTKLEGKVIEVLGKAGQHNTEMHAILAEFGLPIHFPAVVEKEAEQISEKISEEEVARRRDFRGIRTFTIDPEDAKDFDDALSIKYLPNGNYEVGVHIADVTHYVQPNTELEKEAYRRATSVYLVDRTVPMLPEKLSNNLCSLRPNEDKLTFSAVFELTTEAKIVKQWFGRTAIHSDRRFSYEQAQELLESSSEKQEVGREPKRLFNQVSKSEEIPLLRAPKRKEKAVSQSESHKPVETTVSNEAKDDWAKDLILLNNLAKLLRTERFKNGAINFETIEVKFRLAEDGTPISVFQKIRKDAHKLIEEFMLLANRKVAEYIFSLAKTDEPFTMVYRIHEPPNFEKLQSFATFAKRFGYQIRIAENNISHTLNDLMARIEGRPEQNVLESLAVRAMSKARYTTQPIGHFGLAFAHYTHFTSPIRRYPDMMAHRLLQHYLLGGKSADQEVYEKACKVSSEREKLASDAERASIKYKQVEFMSKMTPNQIFDGIVTGVTEFGFFVEISETACEGLVRMSDLQDDFYEYDKDNYRIVGKRSGRVITFGDGVRVKVKETNIARRSMDLTLVALKSGNTVKKLPVKNTSRRSNAAPKGHQRKQASSGRGRR